MPRPFHHHRISVTGAFLLAGLGALGCGDDAGTGAGGSGGAGLTSSGGSSPGGAGGTAGAGGAGGTAGAGGGVAASLAIVELGLPVDLTPDGATALIQDLGSSVGDVYTYDTASAQLQLLTSVGDASRDLATAISATGRVTALHGVPVEAGLFSTGGDWLDLASSFGSGCDQDHGSAWDVSADGSIVVGLMWNVCATQAFRWTDDGGAGTTLLLDLLGASAGPLVNRATVVSDDGSVAAGFASNDPLDRSPAVWRPDGSGFLLDPTNVDVPGEVLSVSADGSFLAGIWGTDGFLWTEQGGRVDLGKPAVSLPTDPCYPNAIAAGGDLVFGGCGDPFLSLPVAFVWTPSQGMRALADVVTASGLEIPAGLTLSSVLASSNDGTVVLGAAVDETMTQKTFVLVLPAAAY